MRYALLLDDEQIERTILEAILSEAGFDVHTSPISTASSLAVDDHAFDIAILDVSAGNQARILDVCNGLAGTAILVMTDNGTIKQALRLNAIAGAVHYIKKPFSKEEFLAAVSLTIQHAQVLRENRALKQQEAIPTSHNS